MQIKVFIRLEFLKWSFKLGLAKKKKKETITRL